MPAALRTRRYRMSPTRGYSGVALPDSISVGWIVFTALMYRAILCRPSGLRVFRGYDPCTGVQGYLCSVLRTPIVLAVTTHEGYYLWIYLCVAPEGLYREMGSQRGSACLRHSEPVANTTSPIKGCSIGLRFVSINIPDLVCTMFILSGSKSGQTESVSQTRGLHHG